MKNPFASFLLRELGLLLLAIMLLLFVATPVRAQVNATSIASAITNSLTLALTNGTYTAAGTTNLSVDVWQNRYFGVFANAVTTNASTSNVTFAVEFTPDGTNWNTQTLDFVLALNGTTQTKGSTNFPLHLTANMRKARIKTIASTAIATYWATNIFFIRN
jgi:hypothetical protein